MVFRLDNIDSRGVIWKVFRSKDLQLSKNVLNGLIGASWSYLRSAIEDRPPLNCPRVDPIIAYGGIVVSDGGHACL